jgi:hypothetical protein
MKKQVAELLYPWNTDSGDVPKFLLKKVHNYNDSM